MENWEIASIEIKGLKQIERFLSFAVENVRCINNLPNMDPFLVVVHNLKPASSDMLDLGAKYLIRTLNYTPRPINIIIRLRLLLFFAEQYLSALSPAICCLLYYNNFCFKVLSNGSDEGVSRVVITVQASVFACSFQKLSYNSINHWYSISVFEEFKNCNILSFDKF